MPLNVYGGMCDHEGDPASFLFENNIRAFKKDYSAVISGMQRLNEGLKTNIKLSSISANVSMIVSKDECSGATVKHDFDSEDEM